MAEIKPESIPEWTFVIVASVALVSSWLIIVPSQPSSDVESKVYQSKNAS